MRLPQACLPPSSLAHSLAACNHAVGAVGLVAHAVHEMGVGTLPCSRQHSYSGECWREQECWREHYDRGGVGAGVAKQRVAELNA